MALFDEARTRAVVNEIRVQTCELNFRKPVNYYVILIVTKKSRQIYARSIKCKDTSMHENDFHVMYGLFVITFVHLPYA